MSSQWRGRPERGSRFALRLIVWLALHIGRTACRVLLVPISAYFFVTDPRARRASHTFMQRALSRPARWRDTFLNLYVFATTLLDRIYLLNGRQSEVQVEVENEAAFFQALRAGKGCLLLGSHLGSFDMLGVIGSVEKQLIINVVMHVDDTTPVREALAAMSSVPYRIIPLGTPGSMLQVKECLDRGEVVGILADRVFGDEATQDVPFLGAPARFSLSPFRLAAITGAPALSVFGLFERGRRYRIVFEPLEAERNAEGGIAPKALQLAYVDCLARQARRSPYNWFNFYDFWIA
jgi:predicted LPLAT superfamily acyltransferase